MAIAITELRETRQPVEIRLSSDVVVQLEKVLMREIGLEYLDSHIKSLERTLFFANPLDIDPFAAKPKDLTKQAVLGGYVLGLKEIQKGESSGSKATKLEDPWRQADSELDWASGLLLADEIHEIRTGSLPESIEAYRKNLVKKIFTPEVI